VAEKRAHYTRTGTPFSSSYPCSVAVHQIDFSLPVPESRARIFPPDFSIATPKTRMAMEKWRRERPLSHIPVLRGTWPSMAIGILTTL